MKDLSEAITRKMVAQFGDDEAPAKRPLPMQARNLKDILSEAQRKNPFKERDLVVQRRNARRYKWPSEEEVAIVSYVPPEGGTVRTSSADATYNREDMVILCLVGDGTWIEFAVESWRFDRYEGEVDAS